MAETRGFVDVPMDGTPGIAFVVYPWGFVIARYDKENDMFDYLNANGYPMFWQRHMFIYESKEKAQEVLDRWNKKNPT